MLTKALKSWLLLPEVLEIKDLDEPENIHLLRQIIKRKPFLFKTYKIFYRDLIDKIKDAPSDGSLVELGSGASFLKQEVPYLITSDVLPYAGVDRVFSALDMPMGTNSVSAFVMVDVLHHIKDSRIFFREVDRCLKIGGKMVMIEPANTGWSRFIYKNFHHEPFNTRGTWGFEEGGPLSGANMAIPWIIFCRDRQQFEQEFAQFRIRSISCHTPLRYLLSGGLSVRQLVPSWFYQFIQVVEWLLSPINRYVGLFMTIEIEKVK